MVVIMIVVRRKFIDQRYNKESISSPSSKSEMKNFKNHNFIYWFV